MSPPRRRRLDKLSHATRPVPFSYRLHRRMGMLTQLCRDPDRSTLGKSASAVLPPLFLEPPVGSKPPPPTCSIEEERLNAAAAEDAAQEAREQADTSARPRGDKTELAGAPAMALIAAEPAGASAAACPVPEPASASVGAQRGQSRGSGTTTSTTTAAPTGDEPPQRQPSRAGRGAFGQTYEEAKLPDLA